MQKVKIISTFASRLLLMTAHLACVSAFVSTIDASLVGLPFVPKELAAEERSVDKEDSNDGDVYDANSKGTSEISDPFEGWNRGVFWFNDKLDRYLLEPVADGYDYVMPDPAQRGVTNFFDNLLYPRYLVSDIVQFKFSQALEHTGRFLINSTVGIFGFIDVAKHVGLERHQEDIGLALGYHGVSPGPYLVFPFFGPSNMRDGVGLMFDMALNPVGWAIADAASSNDAIAITAATTAIDVVQQRANLDEAIEAARDASLDYYLFVQSAYYQRREALIHDHQLNAEKAEEEDPFAEDEAFDEEFGEE